MLIIITVSSHGYQTGIQAYQPFLAALSMFTLSFTLYSNKKCHVVNHVSNQVM